MEKKMSKVEWLKFNGFTPNGVTYLVVGNSYPIKDELKEAGFKFSSLLRWHSGNPLIELPPECVYLEFKYDDYFIWDENTHTSFLQNGARERIELIFNPTIEVHSKFVGKVGDRIRDIIMTVRAASGYESAFGYKWVYTFEDEAGNYYSWATTNHQCICIGAKYNISGTIKDHLVYKNIPTTQLTRGVIKDI